MRLFAVWQSLIVLRFWLLLVSQPNPKANKLTPASATPTTTAFGIIPDSEKLYAMIKSTCEAWPDNLVRLGAAALVLYRLRPGDVSTLTLVQILWIIMGGRYLRAHEGRAFFYVSELGYFEHFDGLLPPDVLAQTAQFLLTLEGIFRVIPAGTRREDKLSMQGLARQCSIARRLISLNTTHVLLPAGYKIMRSRLSSNLISRHVADPRDRCLGQKSQPQAKKVE